MPKLGRRLCGAIAAISLVALLAGCHQGAISPEARFDPRGGSGTGLVVIGMRVAREPVGHNWVFGDYDINPVYSIQIGAIGADGRLGRATRELGLCDAGRLILNGAFSSCDPAAMRYQVIEVPAGQYTLVSFAYRARRLLVVTNFVGPDPSRTSPPRLSIDPALLPRIGDLVARPGRSFTVNAGDIVTVGEMTFDASGEPAQISMTRNDAGAQAALRGMPNVAGEVVFKPIFGP